MMGFSPGEFSGYTMGHWEDGIHWEAGTERIRLWDHDEMTPLLVLMDKEHAEKCLKDLKLLVEMTWPE